MSSIACNPSLLLVGKPPPLPVSSSFPSQLCLRCCSSPDSNNEPPQRPAANKSITSSDTPLVGSEPAQLPQRPSPRPRKTVDSTDWVSSSITRRFGLGAGLAWVGFLAFGVISEQIKTRREVFIEEKDTRDVKSAEEVILPNKVRYVDLTIGGGASPIRGDLVVVDLMGTVESNGRVFVDTFSGNKRSIAFIYGAKPYARGMCKGLEEVLLSMRVGGKRKAVIPPDLAFGDLGEDLGEGIQIPPNATLEYTVQLQKASIAPS